MTSAAKLVRLERFIAPSELSADGGAVAHVSLPLPLHS